MNREKTESVLNRPYIALFTVNLIVSMSFYMLSTTVAMYAKQVGLEPALIGTVVGALSVASMCVRPFTGALCDAFNGKRLLIASLLLIAAAVTGCSLTASVPLLIAFRALHGAGFSMATTITMALVAGTLPPSRMAQGLGYFAVGQTVSSALAPSVGLALGNAYGFDVTFRVAAALLALASALAALAVSSPEKKTERRAVRDLRPGSFFAREALPFAALAVVVSGCTGLENSYLALLGESLGLGNVGWYFTLGAFALFAARMFGGRVIDRHRRALPACVAAMGCAFLLLGLTAPGLGVAALTAMLGCAALLKALGLGTVQPALQAGSINRVSPERRGAASSTYYFGTDIGQALSPMAGGLLAGHLGYQGMFRVAAIPVLASAALALWFGLGANIESEE